MELYLSQKPEDIGNKCVFFERFGKCQYGYTCRYAGAHMVDKKLIVDEEKAKRLFFFYLFFYNFYKFIILFFYFYLWFIFLKNLKYYI